MSNDLFTKARVIWNRRPLFATSCLACVFGLTALSLGISNYTNDEVGRIWPVLGLCGLALFFARFPGPPLIRASAYLIALIALSVGLAQFALLWGAQQLLAP